MIELERALTRFTANAEAIAAVVRGVTDEQARWRPGPDDWSILEVVNHLYDEEREDFRTRLDLTLHAPDAEWPPIDPTGWVLERSYNTRDPGQSLEDFLRERHHSLDWLARVELPNWSSTHHHPDFGAMTAEVVLGAWLAHDHLHLRQLNHLSWQLLARDVPSASLAYAGGW